MAMAVLREKPMPARTASHPVLPRLTRKPLVRQQASLDSVLSPDYAPKHVVMASSSAAGEPVSWKVFVTEVGGASTLDLYGGWSQRPPLTHLPVQVCDLVGLQRLWVSHHLLTSLPPSLPHLTYLCELFLHQNKFTEFPSVICRLPQLRMLWLSYNQIPRIPEEISILTLLRRLHLDHNAITELPDALCTLSQLQVLYLSHNLVEHISENIASLVSIKHLLLDHNQLSELPLGIVDLQDIQRLDLGHNQLKNLPNEFRAFQTEKNGAGRRVSTTNNPLEKTLTRMRSVDHTSPVSPSPDHVVPPLCRIPSQV